MADREFLFEYRFDGSVWGISIHANDLPEARKKIQQVAFAVYKGEVSAKIPLTPRGWWRWLCRIRT